MITQTVVIKYGGHAMDKDELNAAFADDMAFLQQSMRLFDQCTGRCIQPHSSGQGKCHRERRC